MWHRAKTSINSILQIAGRTLLVAVSLLLFLATLARGQTLGGSLARQNMSSSLNGAAANINVAAVLPASVGVSLSDVNLIISVEDPNTPTDAVRLPVTSFWHLGSCSTGVELVGYFDSPRQALVDASGNAIPSTRVEGAISGQELAPFAETSSVGTLAGSRTLYRQPISQNNFSGWRSDVVEIRVARISDLGLQSGTYGGTLHLRMVAY